MLRKPLQITAQRLDNGFVLVPFGKAAQHMAHALKHRLASTLGTFGNHLCRRQHRELIDVFRTALGDNIKFTHRVHFIVKKLHAHGIAQRRPEIQNASAQGILPHTLDRLCTHITGGNELLSQRTQIILSAHAQLQRRIAQSRRRQRALQQSVHRGNKNRRAVGRKGVQRTETLLLPAVGCCHAVTQLPFARKEHLRLCAE